MGKTSCTPAITKFCSLKTRDRLLVSTQIAISVALTFLAESCNLGPRNSFCCVTCAMKGNMLLPTETADT